MLFPNWQIREKNKHTDRFSFPRTIRLERAGSTTNRGMLSAFHYRGEATKNSISNEKVSEKSKLPSSLELFPIFLQVFPENVSFEKDYNIQRVLGQLRRKTTLVFLSVDFCFIVQLANFLCEKKPE